MILVKVYRMKCIAQNWLIIWYDLIWYDMIWYDMIWYHIISYHIESHHIARHYIVCIHLTIVVLRMNWIICNSSAPLWSWVRCATWGIKCLSSRMIVLRGASACGNKWFNVWMLVWRRERGCVRRNKYRERELMAFHRIPWYVRNIILVMQDGCTEEVRVVVEV